MSQEHEPWGRRGGPFPSLRVGEAAMAASRDRRASIIDDEAEDVDEVTLDASHETGLRKVQVSTWLLFEDSTSSLGAKVVQGVLLMLILISTINMLIESHTACRFEVRSEPPAANAGLSTSWYQRTCDEVTWSTEQAAQFEAVETVRNHSPGPVPALASTAASTPITAPAPAQALTPPS